MVVVPPAPGVAVTIAAGGSVVDMPISRRYTTGPAGPLTLPLRKMKFGRFVEMLPTGSSGVGGSITTGFTTEKCAVGEYGPVLAPSTARARQ